MKNKKKPKYERCIINLLIQRTLFLYNIAISETVEIPKSYKKSITRFMKVIKKYLSTIRYMNWDAKSVKYMSKNYSLIMERIDYLDKKFTKIYPKYNDFINLYSSNLVRHVGENYGSLWNPEYDKNYIPSFADYICEADIVYVMNNCPLRNKFYLVG